MWGSAGFVIYPHPGAKAASEEKDCSTASRLGRAFCVRATWRPDIRRTGGEEMMAMKGKARVLWPMDWFSFGPFLRGDGEGR